jgi:hypothetical protein
MQGRLGLAAAFVAGLVVVGAAVASANGRWSTHLSGDEEPPLPGGIIVVTDAQGQAIFKLSDDRTELAFKLIASNITNVTQAHIHVGPAGVNGPIGVWLYPQVTGPPAGPANAGRHDGVLAEGTIVAANLTGPIAGQTVEQLAALLDSGGAYVNVHTNDGVAPTNTGPGDFPGGEIRGQVR